MKVSIGHSGCHSENIKQAPHPGYGKGQTEMKATLEALTRQERKRRRRRRAAAGARRGGRVNRPPATAGIVSEATLGRLIETVKKLAGILDKLEVKNEE